MINPSLSTHQLLVSGKYAFDWARVLCSSPITLSAIWHMTRLYREDWVISRHDFGSILHHGYQAKTGIFAARAKSRKIFPPLIVFFFPYLFFSADVEGSGLPRVEVGRVFFTLFRFSLIQSTAYWQKVVNVINYTACLL